ncbi:SDR family NAD(P)-dependent oxidoreductase [Devosia sp. 67-54]|uniref:SDR family NAD(P)-dependent oxidoreductase n=1 Tax=unclassified Devosia TaxID=196773 RepID=UPI0026CC2B3F
MQSDVRHRVAWVTGAGSGIGHGLALRLARDGWRVAVSARTATDLDALAAESKAIAAFPLDVTDEAGCARTTRRIEGELGPIELAVFNAGAYFPTTAEDFSVANFRKTVDVNLLGEVNCMAGVVPSMLARRSGHIVLMGSLTGFVGLPTAASYGATKAALNNMAQAFKPDFERFGITISVINPGFVKTPATDRNTFPMPFLIGVDEAVDHIMAGIARRQFDISFPWQMRAAIRLLQVLPNWAKFAITRRMLPR